MEQLLDYFVPQTYDLALEISRDPEVLRGQVTISGQPKTKQIKLHAADMDILAVTGAEVANFSHANDVLEIQLRQQKPKVNFTVEFVAKLNHNMQACYLSTYHYQGAEKRLVATQFESHYAREAFPCIDEPAAKAEFRLTLTVSDLVAEDVVLANTPIQSQAEKSFIFEPTPRMSTYLLAWVIGPLKSVSAVNQNGVKVTSYCALNQSEAALRFANETAAKVLDYYDQKYQIDYPLPKLDQVALPDFEAGAMENWGLVTYRESCLLANPDASLDTKRSVAVTVTHELAHQWFGDLVTMQWWDDLWLNEAFATIMEYYATDALYPEFEVWQDFFTSDCVAALSRDCLPGVQAVCQPVHHPAEIATLFDSAIVYAKGARLILMLVRLLGEDQFDRGVHDYFLKHQYQNTVGDDLWRALQPYADFDIKTFMHAWISQPGYPALRDGKQRRFLIDGSTDDTKWPLPEVFDDMSGHYLLDLGEAEFSRKLDAFAQLSSEQKLRLLIDRKFLAKTVEVPSSSLLDLLPKFVHEASSAVWEIVGGIINDLKLFCPWGTPAARDYQAFLKRLLRPEFQTLDLSSSLDADQLRRRGILLGIACYVEDAPVLRQLADLYQDDLTKLDAELRDFILLAQMFFDEATVFPNLLEHYQEVSNPEIKATILYILSRARLPENLDVLFGLLEKPEVVRPQDHIFLFAYLARADRTRTRALDWLIQNWSYVVKLTGDKSVEDYVRCAAGAIRTPEEARKFTDFFDPMADNPILSRALRMARVDIDARLKLIAADAPGVEAKLKQLAKGK